MAQDGMAHDNDEDLPHGRFYWNELMTDDVDKAKAFYAATLGWQFADMPMDEQGADGQPKIYAVALLGEEPVAGVMDMTDLVPPGVPPHWFSYICVDDIARRVALLEANGGSVVRAPFEIPGVGRIAIVADATGAFFGLMMPQ